MMKGTEDGGKLLRPSGPVYRPHAACPGYDQIYPSPIYALPFRTEREGIRLKFSVRERLSCYFLS
jgi:hypothetical protein